MKRLQLLDDDRRGTATAVADACTANGSRGKLVDEDSNDARTRRSEIVSVDTEHTQTRWGDPAQQHRRKG